MKQQVSPAVIVIVVIVIMAVLVGVWFLVYGKKGQPKEMGTPGPLAGEEPMPPGAGPAAPPMAPVTGTPAMPPAQPPAAPGG